jgi:hypothetical protein
MQLSPLLDVSVRALFSFKFGITETASVMLNLKPTAGEYEETY